MNNGNCYVRLFLRKIQGVALVVLILDTDELPKHGEKPDGWKASGRRIRRGMYKTNKGYLINADCNGAANIIRKVAMMLGLELSGISRGCLSQPKKVRLWTLQKSPRLQIREA